MNNDILSSIHDVLLKCSLTTTRQRIDFSHLVVECNDQKELQRLTFNAIYFEGIVSKAPMPLGNICPPPVGKALCQFQVW